MISLDKIKQKFLEGKQIEEIVKDIDWRDFEELVSEILEKHGFKTWNNFRFKTKKRYEIDLIATKGSKTLLIDCKQWSTGRYKKSALKNAIDDQEERLGEFKKFIKNNPIAKNKLKLDCFL
jgi:Holliday junction resolvase-like predicted endonuclease